MRPSLVQRLAARASGALGRESRLVRWLRPSYERLLDVWSGRRGFLVTLNGRETFFVDPAHRSHYGASYEPEVCSYLRSRVRPGATVLNVGGHVGVYAACFAQWSAPAGRVFSFEPNPETRRILEALVARNDLVARVEVVPCAVGGSVGEATFFASGTSGTNRLAAPNPEAGAHESVTVPVTTIDAFCAERGVSPDWITLDIEGFEVAALEGARRTLEAGRGRLSFVVEMHPFLWASAGTTRERFEALLAELGLAAVSIDGHADPFAQNGVAALEWRR